MFRKIWDLIKDTVSGFSSHEAMSHAAAIAYFTIFSLAPLLLIVISIAGWYSGARRRRPRSWASSRASWARAAAMH